MSTRLTIRERFLIVLAVVTTSLLGLGLWSVLSSRAEQRTVDALFERANQAAAQAAQLRRSISEIRRLEANAMAIGSTNTVEVQRLRGLWKDEAKALRDAAVALERDDAEVGKALQQQLDAYMAALDPVLAQLEGATIDGAVALAYAQRAEVQVKALTASGDALRDKQQQAAAQVRADLAASSQTAAMLRLLLVGLSLAIVVPLMLWTLRSVCAPLEQAVSAARRIAGGDLSPLPEAHGRDETAQLLQALAEMQRGLSDMVRQVRQSAESIQVASREVASGNMDLSQRTEQAAGNLQQTAGAMQQLSGVVAHSAEAAAQADQLATSAASVAQRGGSVVEQVVSTMDQINDSSRRIADIVGVIDGIAFQTNILALNAAVEAARAGEQGRGFAVVASEVRALAQRSASAAREIKALIGGSVERVEAGSRHVADAGRTMSEIVASVHQVTEIVGRIAGAAREQNGGLGQIHGSVAQLDQMTQQNAALVEQSAAAAESLNQQAQSLSLLVARFRLNDDAAATLA